MSESTKQTEGWYWPPNARKAHFYNADSRSACGRWSVLMVPSYDGGLDAPPSKDDCAGCRRKVNARLAKASA